MGKGLADLVQQVDRQRLPTRSNVAQRGEVRSAGFRPVHTLLGSAVVLTEGPLDVDPDNSQPVVIVASSLGSAPITDRATAARAAFEALAGMEEITIASQAAAGPDSHRIAGSSHIILTQSRAAGGSSTA